MEKIKNEIYAKSTEFIQGVDTLEFADDLINQYTVDFLVIDFDKTTVSQREEPVEASAFNGYPYMHEHETRKVKRPVITYHHPYKGDTGLLSIAPSNILVSVCEAYVDQRHHSIDIDVPNHHNNLDAVKHSYHQQLDGIKRNYTSLAANFAEFNARLASDIPAIIEDRRRQLEKQQNFLLDLNVPLRPNPSVSPTFSVPRPKLREKITVKSPESSSFTPEPALDGENYNKILQLINDIGQNFERLPSVYKGKQEEDLRDFILFVLDPNFEMGSASGETFNKSGKTDILLRYNSGVVFVAECKFWKGEKGYHETIDQLLGYLTWRNSKTAIVNFVKNRGITDVFEKIKSATEKHSCHVRPNKHASESWQNYIFHLPGDKKREIELAVITFHLPET